MSLVENRNLMKLKNVCNFFSVLLSVFLKTGLIPKKRVSMAEPFKTSPMLADTWRSKHWPIQSPAFNFLSLLTMH